ncbi:hypothetical protein [Legionella sp.]|uniref:hypothetical protein n=1 Tax=Legionella sp. TaxID=459 RepID=UPI003D0D0308
MQFKFPYIPNTYIKYFGNAPINKEIEIEGFITNKINICDVTTKINTEDTSNNTLENTEENSFFEDEDNIELNTEVNTPSGSVKNIIFNKINNNNNNNNKHGICSNFTPNAETISRAKILGYSNVEDPTEIQSFIEYNTACGAQWADFNPIYLRWLAKSQERQQQKNQMKNTRSFNHENQHRNNTKTNPSSVRERVIQAYASEFNFCEETRRFDSKAEQEQRIYCDFVAAIN